MQIKLIVVVVVGNSGNEIGPQDPRTATLLWGGRKVYDLGGPR